MASNQNEPNKPDHAKPQNQTGTQRQDEQRQHQKNPNKPDQADKQPNVAPSETARD